MSVSSNETVKLRSPMRTLSHPVEGGKVRKNSQNPSLNLAPWLWANGKRSRKLARFFTIIS